ncbi:MAG: SDR family NAD(P)-dependent oxidoreductase [Candidatus Odinarchaeota archaeon]
MSMKGKIVVITGANKGMGKAMSEMLAGMGATVYMVCRNEKRGTKTLAELKRKNLGVILKLADLEKPADIENLAKEISEEQDRVDVLINSGAVNLEKAYTRVENVPLEILERTMAINFRGYFLMCQKFIPLLRKSESGRIINFSSGLGQLTVDRMDYYPVYSISKTAVNALTKNLANELRKTNIMVFSVDPGWVKTDLGGPQAPLSISEGIDTPVFLAAEPAQNLKTGEFYKERNILGW